MLLAVDEFTCPEEVIPERFEKLHDGHDDVTNSPLRSFRELRIYANCVILSYRLDDPKLKKLLEMGNEWEEGWESESHDE